MKFTIMDPTYLINNLLDEYKVDNSSREEIKDDYRDPIQDILEEAFKGHNPNIRYGGSLIKGTANINDCDIDILCYISDSSILKPEEIYEIAFKALQSANYFVSKENNAIKVTGKVGESNWDKTIDVVPGKYINNDNNFVNLWSNRDKEYLITNPVIQVGKVQKCNCKDIIRIIKLYRQFVGFKFKSFFLEIFAIDIVEKTFEKDDSIYDKLVKFCKLWNKIGEININDPANPSNNIMNIHSENEFENIRLYIYYLYEALLTYDETCINSCLHGKKSNLADGYVRHALDHSDLNTKYGLLTTSNCGVTLIGKIVDDNDKETQFFSDTIIKKHKKLRFYIDLSFDFRLKDIKLIICNAGYEAFKAGQLRGKKEPVSIYSYSFPRMYMREENTLYAGNHFAQAVVTLHTGQVIYSNLLMVAIR